MSAGKETKAALDDIKIHVKIKISTLWVSLVLCYLYGDYFGLFRPGTLQDMLQGGMGPLGAVTQGVLLGVSVMMAIPCVMVFFIVSLKTQLEPVVEYYLGSGLCGNYAALYAWGLEFLHILRHYRNCNFFTDCLVCMDVASTGSCIGY